MSLLILLVVFLTTVSISGYVATIGQLGRICIEFVVADMKKPTILISVRTDYGILRTSIRLVDVLAGS